MAASVRYRPQERTLGMVMKEVDKTLALFLEMRSRGNEKNDLVLAENLNEIDDIEEMKWEKAFVNSQNHVDDTSDMDWLLTPPDCTASLSIGVEKPTSLKGQNEYSLCPAISSQFCDANSSEDSGSLNNKSMHSSKSIGSQSSVTGNRRPNLSGRRKSTPCRPLTPAPRSSLLTMTESTRAASLLTSVSRAALPSTKVMPPAVKSSSRIRSVTPTPISLRSIPSNFKPTSRSVTPTPIVRSSVPPCNSKSIPRSVTPTPTTRTSLPTTTKSKSRSVTPTSTARSSVPSTSKSTSRSTTPTSKHNANLAASSNQSSKVEVTGSSISKKPVLSRGASPTVKSRPSNLPEMPGLLPDVPDLATSMIKRSKSAPRGQPRTAHSATSSNESSLTMKPRQQSCSPSRGRFPNVGTHNIRPSLLSKSQGYGTGTEDLNPVLIGTKMVERVVNMRRLVPPRQADNSSEIIASKKSSVSQENTGFGRSFSKKSLDMAIRHMDITRSLASDEHPLAVNPSDCVPPRARP